MNDGITAPLAGQFAACVREVRAEEGLTQDQFAERLGIKKRYLAGIEAGEYNLTFAVAEELGRKMGITFTARKGEAHSGAAFRRSGRSRQATS